MFKVGDWIEYDYVDDEYDIDETIIGQVIAVHNDKADGVVFAQEISIKALITDRVYEVYVDDDITPVSLLSVETMNNVITNRTQERNHVEDELNKLKNLSEVLGMGL